MAKTLRVPSFDSPTIFNRDMLTGLAVGVASIALPGPLPLLVLATPIFGVAGGIIGKQRMENEQNYGKEVQEPSWLNGGIVRGVAGGILATMATVAAGLTIAVISAFAAAPGVLESTAAMEATIAGISTGGLLTTVATIAAPFTMLAGAAIGAFSTKSAMEKEYHAAAAYVREHGEVGQAKQPTAYIVSKEEAKLLESRLKKGGNDIIFSEEVAALRSGSVPHR